MTPAFSLRPAAPPSLLAALFAVACGGTYVGSDGTGGQLGVGGSSETGGVNSETGGEPATGGGGPIVCCLAAAVCDEGDTEIASEADCPSGAHCYSNQICCSTVWCVEQPLCDSEANVNVHYVGHSQQECQLVDYVCPEQTTGFSNECGCGCEQPSTCPETIDCEPGGTANPMCVSEECPYSARAF